MLSTTRHLFGEIRKFCQALTSKNHLKALRNHQESNSAHFALNYNNLSKHYSAEIAILGGFPAVQTTSIPAESIPNYPSGHPEHPFGHPGHPEHPSRRCRNLIPQPEPTSTETNLRRYRFQPAIHPLAAFPAPGKGQRGRRGWSSRSARSPPRCRRPLGGGSPLTPRLLHALCCQAVDKASPPPLWSRGTKEKTAGNSWESGGSGAAGRERPRQGKRNPRVGPRTGRERAAVPCPRDVTSRPSGSHTLPERSAVRERSPGSGDRAAQRPRGRREESRAHISVLSLPSRCRPWDSDVTAGPGCARTLGIAVFSLFPSFGIPLPREFHGHRRGGAAEPSRESGNAAQVGKQRPGARETRLLLPN